MKFDEESPRLPVLARGEVENAGEVETSPEGSGGRVSYFCRTTLGRGYNRHTSDGAMHFLQCLLTDIELSVTMTGTPPQAVTLSRTEYETVSRLHREWNSDMTGVYFAPTEPLLTLFGVPIVVSRPRESS